MIETEESKYLMFSVIWLVIFNGFIGLVGVGAAAGAPPELNIPESEDYKVLGTQHTAVSGNLYPCDVLSKDQEAELTIESVDYKTEYLVSTDCTATDPFPDGSDNIDLVFWEKGKRASTEFRVSDLNKSTSQSVTLPGANNATTTVVKFEYNDGRLAPQYAVVQMQYDREYTDVNAFDNEYLGGVLNAIDGAATFVFNIPRYVGYGFDLIGYIGSGYLGFLAVMGGVNPIIPAVLQAFNIPAFFVVIKMVVQAVEAVR